MAIKVRTKVNGECNCIPYDRPLLGMRTIQFECFWPFSPNDCPLSFCVRLRLRLGLGLGLRSGLGLDRLLYTKTCATQAAYDEKCLKL